MYYHAARGHRGRARDRDAGPRQPLRLALDGIGADEQRAQTLGVPTRWVKVGGFALSAAFAGAAGATMAVRWTYIDPAAVFNPFIGLQTVLIVIVGGATSDLTGPVLAAVAFSLLAEFLRLQLPYRLSHAARRGADRRRALPAAGTGRPLGGRAVRPGARRRVRDRAAPGGARRRGPLRGPRPPWIG